jgi:hypothetical protein
MDPQKMKYHLKHNLAGCCALGLCGPEAAREARFQRFARMLRVPVSDVKKQAAKNATQLLAMADKADRTGRKVNGYTAKQLRAMALFMP